MRWLGLAFLSAVGCSAFVEGTGDKPISDPNHVGPRAGDDAGQGDAGGDASSGCDPLLLPSENPCVIADANGVFVSRSRGTSGGGGTQAQPTSSIAEGLSLAKAKGKRLYVCAESYTEQVTLVESVSMFGYFACDAGNWTISSSKALVTSTSADGVRANAIRKATRVEGFTLVSPNATAASASSFGLVALASPGLSLVRVTVRAGDASSGATGGDAPLVTSSSASDGYKFMPWRSCNGTGAVLCAVASGEPGVSKCTINGAAAPTAQQGVMGGSGALSTKLTCEWSISFGLTCKLAEASRTGGSGARVGAGGTNTVVAQAGPQGAFGANGQNGANVGTFSEAGYVPADGNAGANGEPGGGGGGGGPSDTAATASSGTYYSDSGSGGGAGGCAGGAGDAGRGGGASVAVLLIDSAITIETAELIAGRGGSGGGGGVGAVGTSGGKGGSGWGTNGLGAGGTGGVGGNGGSGGAGGGGPSIALGVRGSSPKQTGVSLLSGTGGTSPANSGLVAGLYAIP